IVKGIEQGLDAEAVAGSEDSAVGFVPKYKGEFAPQPVKGLSAKVLVKMKGNFAVRTRAQSVSRLFELALDRFISVKLTVDHNSGFAVFAGDGLVAGCEVDDAEARVS